MKRLFNSELFRYASLLFIGMRLKVETWAQDSAGVVTKTTTTTHTEHNSWYVEPWVWIAGAIGLILLIAALARRGGKTTTTTTTSGPGERTTTRSTEYN
jgi:hypothetical protein